MESSGLEDYGFALHLRICLTGTSNVDQSESYASAPVRSGRSESALYFFSRHLPSRLGRRGMCCSVGYLQRGDPLRGEEAERN